MGTPAEEFGPYLVYEQLGLGGMATVHRAEAKGIAGFSKQVALKRMLPSVAADASLVKSFIREARLASHLRHENVAQTYDLGKVGTTYFIAMELVPGRNLREILKHCAAVVGHMPLPIAMNIVNQICDALDYAHDLCDEMGQPLGIIHRDVSPANIIVSEGGVVKLIDFGIAKASARSGMQTMSGTIKGKFSYMAPEYLMGSIDARADLFALGVIAHELLANRPLFQGRDDMDTLYRVKDMPILPPSRINPKVPAEIDAIIMTALERDPEQRWQKAHALRMALTTETKRLGIVAHNSQVFEWINQAFTHTRKGTFEEDSEPVISISEGTSELPRAKSLAAMTPAFPRGTPHRAVPDEFSGSDGIQTIVKPVGKRPDEWHQQTDPTIDEMDRPVGGIPADDSGDWIGRTDFPTRLVRKSAQQAAAPDPQLIDTRRERSGPTPRPTPHTVARKTPRPFTPQPSDDNDTLPPDAEYPGELIDEDEIRTLPPRSDRSGRASTPLPQRPTPTPTRAERPSNPPPRPTPPRVDRPSQPPPRPTPPRTDRPSQPPGLAPRSDAQARTIMIDASAAPRPSQQLAVPTSLPLGGPAAPMPIGLAPTLDLPKAAAVVQLPSGALLGSPPPPQRMFVVESRATPNPAREARDSAPPPPVLPILTIPGPGAAGPTPGQVDARHARALLDDLAARGERPSAGKLLGQPAGRAQNTVMKTRIEPAKRSGASNFLLAVLVLIAAGGAAAVVYFALPYLT